MPIFTKTDFIHFLRCSHSLWLEKHKPDVFPRKEFSDFLKKIAREGYEVEAYAQQLFPGGVSLPSNTSGVAKTKEAVVSGASVLFQAAVQTEDNLFARTDVLERDGDGWTLYEVKSSTSVKRDRQHNHILDACFQKVVFERSGYRIDRVCIIHVNGSYRRDEVIVPHDLLTITDVTEEVREKEGEVVLSIRAAQAVLESESINESVCPCFRKTKANHCDAFAYFNGEYSAGSVWELTRISEKKLNLLLDQSVIAIKDVPVDTDLNDRQMRQVRAAVEGRPVINRGAVRKLLDTYTFPLLFFDYETAMHAVPRIIGMRPWQQIPFQFSLHILHEDGRLQHKEYLGDTLNASRDVIVALCEAMPEEGSIVSWHASFEKQRNKEMAETYPAYANALLGMNDRMVDLEDVFKEAYTDTAFLGSTSIKKVLPVLCPDLSYRDLSVQDGTQAMEQWLALVEGGVPEADRQRVREDLLAYCKLDTYAMVQLYTKLARCAAG
ncbi:MAG: DUF2779 domain-containing protein [Candidatus Kaiserbacteria bacterium]|nr:DUF2779 domain-containing protein [Candidatus Kaiserbacteria bacterium]